MGKVSSLLLVAALALTSCRGTSASYEQTEPASKASAEPTADPAAVRAKLRGLDQLFGTSGPLPSTDRPPGQIAATFVASRLGQREFYENMFYSLFDYVPLAGGYALGLHEGQFFFKRLQRTDGVFHLRGPCPPSEQVSVVPWWDKDSSVKVCRDSYRPDVDVVHEPERDLYCELPYLPQCGCGPNLVHCIPQERYAAVVEEIEAEVMRKLQDVVSSGRPFADALTTRQSRRSGLLEPFYYRGRGGLLMDAKDVSTVRMRDKPEGYGAGVITTPFTLNFDDQRTVLSLLYNDFLCLPMVSVTVEAEETMALESSTLRFEGLMELTTKKGCEGCHARLEHGLQAFSGFVSRDRGERFIPEEQHQGQIALKIYDNSDQRATGPATVQWLFQAMTEQPEYFSCMQSRTEAWVFAGDDLPDHAVARNRDAFRRAGRFDELLISVVTAYLSTDE